MTGAIEFSIDEVLEMGQRIEANGAKFYREAANACDEGREMLTKLADQEDLHYATFGGMRGNLSPREKEPQTFDPDDEGSMYIKTLVDHYSLVVNKDPSEALKGSESLDEILDIAAGLEKDSIVFYVTMKELVPKGAGREKVDAIIKEELRHLAWIQGKGSA